MNSRPQTPEPFNEPVLSYAVGTPERGELKRALVDLRGSTMDIPLIIAGEEIRTGDTAAIVEPHDHGRSLGVYHRAGPEHVQRAIDAAMAAHREWGSWSQERRSRVFLKAAELLAGRWRQKLNASTMLGQSKTAHQAEIDAACELVDFWRFNAHFAQRIHEEQPLSDDGVLNWLEYRPLEGFIYAVSPFNFTAIGGNLTGAPAILGNTVVWKPSHSAVYSSYYVAKIFEAAGMPPGVINFVPGNPVEVTRVVLDSPWFSGIHFTGSTEVFQDLWRDVGARLGSYRSYPRLVGETGGKDFVVAHPSADPDALRVALIRGAFEYQGQKCSAASRAYIPKSVWARMGDGLIEETTSLTMGDPANFGNFMGAVIHARAHAKIAGYIERAAASPEATVIAGGEVDASTGYFVRPTIIRTDNPAYESMQEEIFGPVLSLYVYPDGQWPEILDTVDGTSPYALTGAVFAQDQTAVEEAYESLRYAAGNFYINDKPTGAVVGQQPFGGARGSGTNDKAGSIFNLLRWVSPRTVKETLVPPTDYRYPFLEGE